MKVFFPSMPCHMSITPSVHPASAPSPLFLGVYHVSGSALRAVDAFSQSAEFLHNGLRQVLSSPFYPILWIRKLRFPEACDLPGIAWHVNGRAEFEGILDSSLWVYCNFV